MRYPIRYTIRTINFVFNPDINITSGSCLSLDNEAKDAEQYG